jgi:hypothetical protein
VVGSPPAVSKEQVKRSRERLGVDRLAAVDVELTADQIERLSAAG